MILSADLSWVLLSSFLVALMQAGFACLESGFVRAKNSINVSLKNLVDFCISSTVFTVIGFALMFGPSLGGWIGIPYFPLTDGTEPRLVVFLIFQIMFCGTSATIISGAVSERMRFSGYLIVTVVVAGVLYPITGHWIWNGSDLGQVNGWLGQVGFIDFAGSTAVHSVGGWISLAAILVIGPRLGRFGPLGRPIEGHNLPMATLGVFLLWFGFFGFNGGSTLALNEEVPRIIVNTALSGATGGIAAMAASWWLQKRPHVDRIINGVIGGLVAICAGCHLLGGVAAMIVGAVAGVLVVLTMAMLERFSIDDVIGAVPSHLVSGMWGTLSVGLFAPVALFRHDWGRAHQILVQFEGIAAVGLFVFGVSYVGLRMLNRVLPLRVSAADERIGLNIAEHDATTTLLDLITQMDQQARLGDFSRPVVVEPETEAAHIAVFYNAVLDKFHLETHRRQEALERLTHLANYDGLTGLANRRAFFDAARHALAKANRNGRQGVAMYFDLDGFKAVNDSLGHEAGDELLKQVAQRITDCVREIDLVARLGGDEFCLLIDEIDSIAGAEHVAAKILEAIDKPFDISGRSARVGLSIGIAVFGKDRGGLSVEALVSRADSAMYAAKLAGKGRWKFAAETSDTGEDAA